MMKRTTEGVGGEGYSGSPESDGHQKRRKIQFEPVRMPAVSNVNDIKSRAMVYQASKLKQQLLYKNRRIAELEKENDRARRRQQTDESNFLKVYNLFSEIEKYICTQTKNEFGDFEGCTSAPSGTDVQGMPTETYLKFAEDSKNNLRKAFISYAKARHDRSLEFGEYINKIKTVIESPEFNADDALKELAESTSLLAAQNDRLQEEVTRAQSDAYNADRRRRQLLDKQTVLESRVQELEHQLEDSRFEADKQMRLASKFEYKLATVVQDMQAGGSGATASSSGSTNISDKKMTAPSTPPNETIAKEIESLRAEREEQSSLAGRRLLEIEQLNKSISASQHKIVILENEKADGITAKMIYDSEEYKILHQYYSLTVKEYERVCKEMEEIIGEREKLRGANETLSLQITEQQQKTLQEIQQQNDISNTFFRVSHDSDILRFEFDVVKDEFHKTVRQGEWEELKATCNTLRALNATLKTETTRFREKLKQAHKDIHSLKSELKTLKDNQEKCILVPMEDSSSVPPEDVNKIRQEYESLRKELRRLGAIEKLEKQKQVEEFQKEVHRQIADKIAELDTLRKANEALTNDEQSISDELEAIGTAVEEEQERNSQLVNEKRDLEDRNLKMMNERMVQNQILNRLREKLECLENKAQTDSQIVKIQEFAKKAAEDANTKLIESMEYKTGEMTKMVKQMENYRKQLKDVGRTRDERQAELDRYKQVNDNLKKMHFEKSEEINKLRNLESRLKEELDILRSKYDRAKRNESSLSSQTGDQVLEEANRQMKETLTCPSCKTRPKDCIMLKCYHLFCETCIKTMYDTRQRKCPKCNSNFGANDFHRVFI